jgi:hypothetical protein
MFLETEKFWPSSTEKPEKLDPPPGFKIRACSGYFIGGSFSKLPLCVSGRPCALFSSSVGSRNCLYGCFLRESPGSRHGMGVSRF